MTLLVTAVAFFAAVKFSSTMMPRETTASGREKKEETPHGRYIRRKIRAGAPRGGDQRGKGVDILKKCLMKTPYVCATVWNYSRNDWFQRYPYLCWISIGIVGISFSAEYRVT